LITYEVDNVDQVKHKNAREVGATTGSNLGSFPQGGMSDSRSASETGRATHVGVHKYKIMDRDGGVGGPFLFMEVSECFKIRGVALPPSPLLLVDLSIAPFMNSQGCLIPRTSWLTARIAGPGGQRCR